MIYETSSDVLLLNIKTPAAVIERLKHVHDQLCITFRPTAEFKPDKGLKFLSRYGEPKINTVLDKHIQSVREYFWCISYIIDCLCWSTTESVVG